MRFVDVLGVEREVPDSEVMEVFDHTQKLVQYEAYGRPSFAFITKKGVQCFVGRLQKIVINRKDGLCFVIADDGIRVFSRKHKSTQLCELVNGCISGLCELTSDTGRKLPVMEAFSLQTDKLCFFGEKVKSFFGNRWLSWLQTEKRGYLFVYAGEDRYWVRCKEVGG